MECLRHHGRHPRRTRPAAGRSAPAAAPEEAEKMVRLVSVVDELLAWDKAWPKGEYHSAMTAEKILNDIVNKLHDLRGDKP